jgi:hypothetical protein
MRFESGASPAAAPEWMTKTVVLIDVGPTTLFDVDQSWNPIELTRIIL